MNFNCNNYKNYIKEVKQFLQDIPEKRYLALNPDGTEFSEDEICDAIADALTRWQLLYTTTYYMPVIPIMAIRRSFVKLIAGILLRKKAIYYLQNSMSVGDIIEVSDFEVKQQTYEIIGTKLQQEAEEELYNHKVALLSKARYIK